eukprot:1326927-Amphidinium_carterae.1
MRGLKLQKYRAQDEGYIRNGLPKSQNQNQWPVPGPAASASSSRSSSSSSSSSRHHQRKGWNFGLALNRAGVKMGGCPKGLAAFTSTDQPFFISLCQ